MRIYRFLLGALLLSLFVATRGESAESASDSSFNPENVLLSHFSLPRPGPWHWVSTTTKEGHILLEVIFAAGDAQNENSRVSIYFNHIKPDADIGTPGATAKRWKSWFEKAQMTMPLSKPKPMGTNKVCFVEMTGTFKGPGVSGKAPYLRPDFTLFGAHIEDAEGNILVRMVGPTKLVEKNKAAFNKMIKQTLEAK
ncbi:MAG: hypothetical protein JWM68_4865 [Verrucomicrobiales bacterium]|nr:hypothetical protein [Verrucomicrobiales bacterium]